jgi:hypothetical protein
VLDAVFLAEILDPDDGVAHFSELSQYSKSQQRPDIGRQGGAAAPPGWLPGRSVLPNLTFVPMLTETAI